MPQVSLPIIDLLAHPPIGVLSRVAAPGNPYSGPLVTIAPPVGIGFATYGICLRIHSVGPGHGRDVSFPVEYDPPLGKMCTTFTDLSGFLVIQQVELWTFDDQWYVWNTPLPSLWSLYMQPDVTADLFLLQS